MVLHKLKPPIADCNINCGSELKSLAATGSVYSTCPALKQLPRLCGYTIGRDLVVMEARYV